MDAKPSQLDSSNWLKTAAISLLGVAVLLGIALRLYQINQPDFYLYDEGFYLNFNLPVLDYISKYTLTTFQDKWGAVVQVLRYSLGTGKALWFMIVDSRVFFGLKDHWYIPRIVSAIAGILTFLVMYKFSSRFYESRKIGWLSVALLALLPAHIFYSRLGIQEALCILMFTCGFYFYFASRRSALSTFLSALFLACAYWTNYRLIILPLLIGVGELYESWAGKRKPDVRKFVWHTLIFLALLTLVGAIDEARNIMATFTWVFYQKSLAQRNPFDVLNFLSYPYCLFKLNGCVFVFLFFSNVYWFWKRQWHKALPFVVVCTLMAGFSLTDEKGARYIAIGYPLMVASVAALLCEWGRVYQSVMARWIIIVVSTVMVLEFLPKDVSIAQTHSDYREAYKYIQTKEPGAKILSSQSYVLKLYSKHNSQVAMLPLGFDSLLEYYQKGFRYIVVDPQMYVSYTLNEQRFTLELKDYLGFVNQSLDPVKTFAHFDKTTLNWFVLEHNTNLRQSIQFLNTDDEKLGQIRIYDLEQFVPRIRKYIQMQKG